MSIKKKTDIYALLNFDSLSEAEKITGMSYKESHETALLGMALMHQNSEIKIKALKEMKDTFYSMTFKEFCTAIEDSLFDFEKVWEDSYAIKRYKSEGIYQDEKEVLYIDYSRGILVYANSFGSKLNDAKALMQFEVKEENKLEAWEFISTGGFSKGTNIVNNSYDAREGILYRLQCLDLCPFTTWLPVWEIRMHIWLLNSNEVESNGKNFNFDKTILDKIKKFPDKVQEFIMRSQRD